jgi:8-amino-7-oxononanoate synthase
MRASLTDRLAARHAARVRTDALRALRAVDQRDGVRLRRDGSWLIDFASNDYLGLAGHPAAVAALRAAATDYGIGSTAAHLVCGHHRAHVELEEAAADWLGQPRALLFGSGYLANLGVLQALLDADDVCLQDKLNHACLLDGARLSGALLKRYPHADVDAARRQLQSVPARAALIATDGVFSMDGDIAPLPALAALAEVESALLYIDDAHGIGVLGPQGRGSAAALGLTPGQSPLQLLTLGKALGGYGALVVGSGALVEAVLQGARSYLFTTALPPALAAAALAALQLARNDDAGRQRLQASIARFRSGALQLGLPLLDSATPIQPLLLGDNARALAASTALAERGLLVPAIRPPTVPIGKARLRITLSAAHEARHIDQLLDALPDALRAADRCAAESP